MEGMLPHANPFHADGDDHGVLVLHGFTGSPHSIQPLATAFAEAGYTVTAPLLPGHGTTVSDMLTTGWKDWSDHADQAYRDLTQRCSRVIVAGFSMGGTVATWLALRHPDLTALIAINPLIDPDARQWSGLVEAGRATDSETLPAVGSDIARPGITESAYDAVPIAPLESVTAALHDLAADPRRLSTPALIFVSPHDHVVDPSSARALADRCDGPVTLRELPRSYHVALLDYDAEQIITESLAFARDRFGA